MRAAKLFEFRYCSAMPGELIETAPNEMAKGNTGAKVQPLQFFEFQCRAANQVTVVSKLSVSVLAVKNIDSRAISQQAGMRSQACCAAAAGFQRSESEIR
jgi:hypothetical protein